MKKKVFLWVFLFAFYLTNSSFSLSNYKDPPKSDTLLKISLYGGLGDTDNVALGNGSRTNYRWGTQISLGVTGQLGFAGVGIDLGYVQSYETKIGGISKNPSYINSLVIGELIFSRILVFQTGLGPSFWVKNSSGTDFTYMLAGGIILPIRDISVQTLGRMDWIYSKQTIKSLCFLIGISCYFKL